MPIPFWAIDKWDTTSDSEPFLARTCWTYILRLFRWARKYGLRVNLDLHTAPGSQNGYNHSGKDGQVNMLFGPMGFANAQRMLNYIRIIAEFIAQEEYQNLIPMYGIINEALIKQIGKDVMTNLCVTNNIIHILPMLITDVYCASHVATSKHTTLSVPLLVPERAKGLSSASTTGSTPSIPGPISYQAPIASHWTPTPTLPSTDSRTRTPLASGRRVRVTGGRRV